MAGWLSKYEWLTSCSGAEIHIADDDSYSIRRVEVTVDGKQLSIGTKKEAAGDLGPAVKKLRPDHPVAITFTGKGVLIRKVTGAGQQAAGILHSAFPNLDAGKFYIQYFESGENNFLALMRKETADGILETLIKEGYTVLAMSLGPFPVTHIIRQLNNYGDMLVFDGHVITLESPATWVEYRFTPGASAEFPLKAGNETIPEKFILAYAVAFQLALYHRLEPIATGNDTVTAAISRFGEEKKLRVRFAVTAVGFFLVLLLNFCFFSFYESRNAALLEDVSTTAASIGNMRQLTEGIRSKEQLLKQLGWNGGVRYAFIFDRIGATMPPQLLLDKIAVNPLKQLNGSGARAGAEETGTINITGRAPGIAAVNEWMGRLKTDNWIKEVRLGRYAPASEKEEQEFTLILNY